MTDVPPPRPLLLVLAHGVGGAELGAVRSAAGWSDLPPAAPLGALQAPVARLLRAGDATEELRALGACVDRHGLVLRPRGRTDASVLTALTGRATGPAPVTLFESMGVLAQAATGGAPAALAQAHELGTQLARLGEQLRRGDRPEVWFVGLGAAAAVHTTFDLGAAFRERVVPPLAHDLTLRVHAGTATIAADNQRACDLAAECLSAAPFAHHGTLGVADAPGRLVFRARPGVAFARHRMAARAPHHDEAACVFAAPVGDTVRARGLDLAELLARFWMRAAALHVRDMEEVPLERDPTPVRSPVAAKATAPALR